MPLSVGERLSAAGDRPTGFDYLRVILSVSIVGWHMLLVCSGLAGVVWGWTGPLRPLTYVLVPSFSR